jgi:hypothetical protein
MPAVRAIVLNASTQRANRWLCSTSSDPACAVWVPAVDGAEILGATDGAEAQPASAKIASEAATSRQRDDAEKSDGFCIPAILAVL